MKLLSLFSGCGGMDLGFEGDFKVKLACLNSEINSSWVSQEFKNGWVQLEPTIFETVFANDIKPSAKSAWIKYFSKRGYNPEVFHLDSIVDLVKRHYEGQTIFPSGIDVVIGGFPCQDFSIAGKRKGFNSHKSHHNKLLDNNDKATSENRGQLYMWMKEVISIVKPKVFIAENVKGLVTLSDAKKIIEEDFRNIGEGYLVVDAKVLHAGNYGVPQSRERIFFVGLKKSALRPEALLALQNSPVDLAYDPYPIKTHSLNNDLTLFNFNQDSQMIKFVPVKEVLRDLPEPEKSSDLSHQSYSKAKWFGKHCQGQREIDLEGLSPTIRSEHHGNIEFRRLSQEHGGRYLDELGHGFTERRLTVRECARIQTFPDDYEFVRKPEKKGDPFKLSATDGYKLIGNAVPPLLAYHFAKRLEFLWSKLFI